MVRVGCGDRADAEFLSAFNEGSLPPGDFHHGDHLRAAWLLLERYPFAEALDAVRLGLQGLAARAGVPGHYHETVTRGWMVLLAAESGISLDEYLHKLPDGVNPLHAYWSKAVLDSAEARAGWVEPDLCSLPRQATLKRDNAAQ